MNSYTDLSNKVQEEYHRVVQISEQLSIPKDKIILIPRHCSYGHHNMKEYSDATVSYIQEQFLRLGWDAKIIFDLPDEGFATAGLLFFDSVSKRLITDFNVSPKNLIYITGSCATERTTQLYNKLCVKLGLYPLNLYYTNNLEADQRNYGDFRETFHSRESKRKKKFISFNKNPRPHRVAILGQIIKRNLLKDAYLSFNTTPESVEFSIVKRFLPQLIDDTTTKVKPFLKELPLNLSANEDQSNIYYPNEMDLMLYRSCLFSLITETLFFNNPDITDQSNQQNMMAFPGHMVTEKTWKTVRAKHPFILATTAHTLKAFRDLGYKTFHPYINESYDDIENDEQRLIAIMDEVTRLCNMSDTETKDWLEKVHEITDYNFQVLSQAEFFIKQNPW